MTTTPNRYCPNHHGDVCPCGGNPSWGSAPRYVRWAFALDTLAAMGGVDATTRTVRCPLGDGEWESYAASQWDVDRPDAGACYVLGNAVLARKDRNQARNTMGDRDAAWTARYVAVTRAAAATVTIRKDADALALYRAWNVKASGTVAAVAWWE